MGTGFGEAVEGWVQLGEWWLNAWGSHVNKIATKVDSGEYSAADAAADLMDCTYLAGETVLLIGAEVVEAAAVLTMDGREPLETPPFPTEEKLHLHRTLALQGPLTSPLGGDQIPVSAVTIVPKELKANEKTFLLRLDPTGYAGVAYLGSVEVFEKGTPTLVDTVTVWVQVP